jgi:hypothetical protein
MTPASSAVKRKPTGTDSERANPHKYSATNSTDVAEADDDNSPLLSVSDDGSNISQSIVFLPDAHAGTVLSGVINLANTILGAGILAMPSAFAGKYEVFYFSNWARIRYISSTSVWFLFRNGFTPSF